METQKKTKMSRDIYIGIDLWQKELWKNFTEDALKGTQEKFREELIETPLENVRKKIWRNSGRSSFGENHRRYFRDVSTRSFVKHYGEFMDKILGEFHGKSLNF